MEKRDFGQDPTDRFILCSHLMEGFEILAKNSKQNLQVVVEVLDSCGDNIDEAIKLLGALQLSQAGRDSERNSGRPGREREDDSSQPSSASAVPTSTAGATSHRNSAA